MYICSCRLQQSSFVFMISSRSLCVFITIPTAGRSAREEGCCPVVTFALVGAKDRSSRNLSAPIGRIAAGLAEATHYQRSASFSEQTVRRPVRLAV